MSRQIFLSELQSINVKNYTLYPNGLDYTYNFVKGVNLILGGNGMGKTTFVNIIKFGLIGLYRKAKDLTRTYQDRAIVRRLLYPVDYFSSRKDDTIQVEGEAKVILFFKIKDECFEICRSLDTGFLLYVLVNGNRLNGQIISEERYERLDSKNQKQYLLREYEDIIEKYSNLTFDDLVFFVNEILFFGENHNTVLWNEGIDGRTDVQTELFNKYFNEPELDLKRQEMQRQAKYYDSLSRHRSEDMRVITKLLTKIQTSKDSGDTSVSIDILELKNRINSLSEELLSINKNQNSLANEISIIQGEINHDSIQAAQLDEEKKRIEKEMNASLWETLHPQYDVFVKNIQLNHLCPICNREANNLVEKINDTSKCFVCGNEIHMSEDDDLINKYREITTSRKSIYQSISNKQRKIKAIEDNLEKLDNDFREKELLKRSLQQKLRELEFDQSNLTDPDKYQTLVDEYNKYFDEKQKYQKLSEESKKNAQELTNRIEEEILINVSRFSSIFAGYAEHFLGVSCSLEYNSYDNRAKRFYPVIDGKVRKQEESLSESQRFFVDHSFRMSILTFFYKSPSFYIVETPDSSLDLSYEKNAAGVFLHFLKKPNIVIVTSNLNNSSFIDHLTIDSNTPLSMVGLLDIAKRSVIQNDNERIKSIYSEIKKRITNE